MPQRFCGLMRLSRSPRRPHQRGTGSQHHHYQLKQVTEFMTRCTDRGIKSDHLLGQHGAGNRKWTVDE